MAYARSKKGKKNKEKVQLPESVVKKLEQVYQLDCTVDEIAYYLDVSRQTIYNWKIDFPDIFDRLERLRQRPVVLARESVMKGVANDPKLALEYLKKKKSDEFMDKTNLDITTQGEKVGQPLSESDKKELLTKALETLKREDKKKCKK